MQIELTKEQNAVIRDQLDTEISTLKGCIVSAMLRDDVKVAQLHAKKLKPLQEVRDALPADWQFRDDLRVAA